ncbi:hypothetical protein AZSP09_23610 [Azospira sp. I09]|nr:hypothetical protein AZSP09_23610 [Azospira sp. I09]
MKKSFRAKGLAPIQEKDGELVPLTWAESWAVHWTEIPPVEVGPGPEDPRRSAGLSQRPPIP